MGNCLVTKLNEAASDEMLVPLGYVELFSASGENKTLNRDYFSVWNNSYQCKLLGDGYFINQNGENVGKSMYFGSIYTQTNEAVHINSGTVKVIAKYNDVRMSFLLKNGNTNVDNLRLLKTGVVSQYLLAGAISGNIANVIPATYMEISNNAYGLKGTGLRGDLKNYTSKSTLPNYIRFLHHPLLSGRVEDLLDNIASVGNDGTFTVYFEDCPNVFYNGNAIIGDISLTVTISNHVWSV